MNGLKGLTEGTQDRESKIRELGVLERMSQSVEQEKAAEIQAQQQEQMFYEKMYQTAESMLGKDRERINKKIILAQRQVREHLDMTGGSRKNFLAEGGMSVLGNLKNQILESDEAFQYKENSKNLAKILEIKEKGLGHLLAPRDLESAENYEKNPEGGSITYSGMMTEVKIPPSTNFDYGTEIPINNVLSYDSNLVKIMGNYKIQHPDAPDLDPQNNPKDYMKLVAFAKKMGYGGTGNNTTAMRARAAASRARAAYENKRSTKQKDLKKSFISQYNVLNSKFKEGTTVEDINRPIEEGGYGGSYWESQRKNDPSVNKILGDKSTLISRKRGLDEKGLDGNDFLPDFIDESGAYLFNDMVGLKDSYRVFQGNEKKIVDRILGQENLGGFKIEGNKVIGYTPGEQDFRMDGVKLGTKNAVNPDDFKGNYEIMGVVTGMKSMISNGDGVEEEALLINAYDDNGELDKDATAKIEEGYTSEMKPTTLIALRNENEDVFYKEIDIGRPDVATMMSNAIAEDDDVTDKVQQENHAAAKMRQIKKMTKDERIMVDRKMNELDQEVFNDEMFKTEGENFYGENSGGQLNRVPEMKAFYMAFDYLKNSNKRDENNPDGDKSIYAPNVQKYIDQEIFTKSIIAAGTEEDFKSYETGNSSDKLIEKWIEGANSDLDQDSLAYKRNVELAAKWKQILNIM